MAVAVHLVVPRCWWCQRELVAVVVGRVRLYPAAARTVARPRALFHMQKKDFYLQGTV